MLRETSRNNGAAPNDLEILLVLSRSATAGTSIVVRQWRGVLIFGGLCHAVDNENLGGRLGGLQLQAQLFLESGVQIRGCCLAGPDSDRGVTWRRDSYAQAGELKFIGR